MWLRLRLLLRFSVCYRNDGHDNIFHRAFGFLFHGLFSIYNLFRKILLSNNSFFYCVGCYLFGRGIAISDWMCNGFMMCAARSDSLGGDGNGAVYAGH